MRYFLHLSYFGQNYHGWQRQTNHISIQETLESVVSEVLKKPTIVIGCGRTDSGVHAIQYFAHFDSDSEINDVFFYRLNKRLPNDISVYHILPVASNAHSRYDAIERTYEYYIHFYKDAHLSGRSAYYEDKASDLVLMQCALNLLPGHDDYRSFCRKPDKLNTTICHVNQAQLFASPSGDRLKFVLSANRFVTGMIRLLVGNILEIGKGRMSLDHFLSMLKDHPPIPKFNHAYPQGLYLSKVHIPYIDVPYPPHPFEIQKQNNFWQSVEA